jgi:hypothetical protein
MAVTIVTVTRLARTTDERTCHSTNSTANKRTFSSVPRRRHGCADGSTAETANCCTPLRL